LVCRTCLAFDVNRRLFGFEEELSNAPDAEAVVRRFTGSGNLNGILMNHVLILFRISGLIGYIPTQRFKKWIDKLYSQLGFIVGRATVGVDVTLEALNEIGFVLALLSYLQNLQAGLISS